MRWRAPWGKKMVIVDDYTEDFENKWCPGCGNFGILRAMKQAMAALGISPQKLLIVSGIGQAAKTPHFLKCNAFHGLHGRALPVATGAKIANHRSHILVSMGDGDCYAEGGNHFLHALRRNVDLTLLVHNNRVFGLTKGQASPTAEPGMVTHAQPHGVIATSFDALSIALSLDCGFVARGFSGDVDHLSELIQMGVKHKGMSLIDILQPCVSFNRINTHQWYAERVFQLGKTDYPTDDIRAARDKVQEWGSRIPIGIFYKKEKPAFTDHISSLQKKTLFESKYNPKRLKRVFQRLNPDPA